jgi:hypothetical protein
MKKLLNILFLSLCSLFFLTGHVNSPNFFYRGTAGHYSIDVLVKPPEAIPGLAEVTVKTSKEVKNVSYQLAFWKTGLDGAPNLESLENLSKDSNEENIFAGQIWLMIPGAYSLNLHVMGEKGEGLSIVPIQATAQNSLELGPFLKYLLLGLLIFLVLGLIAIVGAIVRDGSFSNQKTQKLKSRIAMLITSVILGIILGIGNYWWNSFDQNYNQKLLKTFESTSTISNSTKGPILTVSITDTQWRDRKNRKITTYQEMVWPDPRLTPITPDHGKLMHLFVIDEDSFQVICHLHPVATGDSSFKVLLPDLPNGNYLTFADITHESGYSQTLTGKFELQKEVNSDSENINIKRDPDDSWLINSTNSKKFNTATTFTLADGNIVKWNRQADVLINQKIDLDFSVNDPSGNPVALQPYMGMLSHAAIIKKDKTTFVHLHPIGSISMASQMLFEKQHNLSASNHDHHHQAVSNQVTMPYEFDKSGEYRLWIQFKIDNKVQTAFFDFTVS